MLRVPHTEPQVLWVLVWWPRTVSLPVGVPYAAHIRLGRRPEAHIGGGIECVEELAGWSRWPSRPSLSLRRRVVAGVVSQSRVRRTPLARLAAKSLLPA